MCVSHKIDGDGKGKCEWIVKSKCVVKMNVCSV
jgi:hypothetical protein